MTDEQVEKIIRANMGLQMNIPGIRADFEKALRKPWVSLTDEDLLRCLGPDAVRIPPGWYKLARAIEAKLKEKNA